jgi:polysaccharide biosynthesis transport protein
MMIQYNQTDSPMSPQSFLRIIARRAKLMAALFFGIVITVVGATFIMPRTYKSEAKIIVNYQDDWEKLGAQMGTRTAYDLVASELSILKTRGIIEPVVHALNLGDDKKTPSSDLERAQMHEETVAQLRADLKVEREQDTNILVVSYGDRDPERAAAVVNEVVKQYIKRRPLISKDESALEFFDKLIKDLEGRIDVRDANSQDYKSREGVVLPEKQTQILYTTVADFDKEITRVCATRIGKESRLQAIRQQINSGYDISIPNTEAGNSLSKMEHLNELRKTLLALEMKKSSMSRKYTQKHPEMLVVGRDIENTKLSIKQEVNEIIRVEETDVRAMRAQETELKSSRDRVEASIADMTLKEYELDKRTHGVEQLKTVLNSLITQREQARAAARKKEYLVQARLLEAAAIPFKPASPNKRLYAALSLMLGFIVSFGAAFSVEYFDHSVHTAEDAQYCLGIPVLATIQDVQHQTLAQPKFVENNNIVFKELNQFVEN